MNLHKLFTQSSRWFGRLAALTLGVLMGAPGASAESLYYVGGHGDVGVGYSGSGSSFDMHYHFVNSSRIAFDDPTGPSKTIIAWQAQDGIVIDREQEPDGAITYVGVPTSAASATEAGYLGIAPGGEFWSLPADSAIAAAQNKPWLGFGSEELEDYFLDFSDLTWSITGVSGPGEFAVWKGSGLLWSTATDTTSFTAPIGHDHVFWGFSEAGVYDVMVTVSAIHSTYGLVQGTGMYTFQVGPLPPNAVPEPSSLALVGLGGLGFLVHLKRRGRRSPAMPA